jgi:hypothetical protein
MLKYRIRRGGSVCRHAWNGVFCLLCGERQGSKHRNIKKIVDGLKFDSKVEAKHYFEHELLQRAGKISQLRRQVPFPCLVNGILVCTYVADIVCLDEKGKMRVRDSKGEHTAKDPLFSIKRKLVWACHGIRIEILK